LASIASRQSRSAGALRAQKAEFERICHAPRGSKINSRSRKMRFSIFINKNRILQSKISQSFLFALSGELQSDNLSRKAGHLPKSNI